MNLFNDIEKLSGENFSSAVIRHLALRSTQIREAFLDLLSAKAPDGPISSIDHFAISLEKTTKDGDKTGRIDLIIEVDDAVIGIENKFHSGFQSHQPEYYLKSIQNHRDCLATLKNIDPERLQYFILVLAPRCREQEIKENLRGKKDIDKYVYCSWEEMLDAFASANLSDLVDIYLIKQLADFVNERAGFPPNIIRMLPHLSKKFIPRGSELQKKFVSILWDSLPKRFTNNYSLGVGIDYYGYYISTEDEQHNLWYGFINREIFSEFNRQGSALIISAKDTNVHISDPKEVKVKYWTENQWRCWEIEFKEDWTSRDKWDEAFESFFKHFS